MKTKIALFAVAVAFTLSAAAPRRAEAGSLAKAKKLTTEVMSHLVMMAKILDRNLNTPDNAVTELTTYFSNKKRVKQFAVIVAKMKALKLSDGDKKALKKWAKNQSTTKRIKKSAAAFFKKNPTAIQKLFPVLMKLRGLFPAA